jgi:Peptidase family C25
VTSDSATEELAPDDGLIRLNGIDGVTGRYLSEPFTESDAVALARSGPMDQETGGWLRSVWNMLQRPFLGLPLGVDPTKVAQAGWAVVFAKDTPPAVREALAPLVKLRHRRVPPDRCKELEYRPGESMKTWLNRHAAHPGAVVPTKLPYYVLLVGDPQQIPFQFQYLLDVEYAVGRLSFETAEEYHRYAESVVAYETASTLPNRREVVFWGTRHPSDRATQLSADYLICPLSEGKTPAGQPADDTPIAAELGYRTSVFRGREATKANLSEVLHGKSGSPALLFTASHGMGWPRGHGQQRPSQGALLCQDWSGFGSVNPAHYLAAADVPDEARVHGLVAFLFACYGAGTPAFDNFPRQHGGGLAEIADGPFVAALPRRLLTHPNGSALAVLGHIERAWGYSIRPTGVGEQLQPFRNLLGRILSGEPVGHATKDFSEKYACLSTELLSMLDETQGGTRPTDQALAYHWIERNDAQNYVMLGDPAVQVRADLLR